MHPNPIFRSTDGAHSLTFARARSFGTLATNGDPTPLLAHVPFLLSETADYAELHLVRSNPIARALKNGALTASLSVMGPDSYISPDWYGVPDQVPTWNYVSVLFTGQIELSPQEDLRDLLSRQSAHFEHQLLPKTPWTTDKMSAGAMEKMMRAIVPLRFSINDMQSTWKLGQNKPSDVRQKAAQQVKLHGLGLEPSEIAQWMDSPPATS